MLSPSASCSMLHGMGDDILLLAGTSCVASAYSRTSSPMTSSTLQPVLSDSIIWCGPILYTETSRRTDQRRIQACMQALVHVTRPQSTHQSPVGTLSLILCILLFLLLFLLFPDYSSSSSPSSFCCSSPSLGINHLLQTAIYSDNADEGL